MLDVIRNILLIALTIFFVAMWARFVLDWVRVFARRWRPRGAALVAAEAAYTVTDPPLRLVRRVLPPLRIGGGAIDFSWTVVMLVCLILFSVINRIP